MRVLRVEAVVFALEPRVGARTLEQKPVDVAIRQPGRQTLSESLPAVTQPTQPRTPIPPSTSKTDGPRVSFTIPLPEPMRAQLQPLLEQYARSKAVPSIGRIRAELLLLYVRIVIPASEQNALLAIANHGLHFEDTDHDLFLDFVARSKMPAKKGEQAHVLDRWPCTIPVKLLQDLRGENPKPGEPIGPDRSTPQQDPTSIEDVLWWVIGLLKGDFNENPDVAQTLINGALGLIPGVDQVLDLRDLAANIYALVWKARYDEPAAWIDLALTLLGAIPEAGSVIKTIGKFVKKGAKKIPIAPAIKLAGGFADTLFELLAKLLENFDSIARSVAAQATKILGGVTRFLGEVKESIIKWISTTAYKYLDKLYNAAREAVARVAKRLDEALADLRKAFDDLLEELGLKVGKKVDDIPKTPDVPKTETPRPTKTTKSQTTEKPKRETTPRKTETAEITGTGNKVEITRENLNKGSGGETDIFAGKLADKDIVVRVPRGDRDGGLAMYQLEKARDLEPLGGPKVHGLVEFIRDGRKLWGVVTDRIGTLVNGKFVGGFDLFHFLADAPQPFPITKQHLRALEEFRDRVKAAKVELGDVQQGDFIFTIDGKVVPVDLGVYTGTGKVGSPNLDKLIDKMRDKLGGGS